jgi:opacity protein-like surface antigen
MVGLRLFRRGLAFLGALTCLPATAGFYAGFSVGSAHQSFTHKDITLHSEVELPWSWGTEGANWGGSLSVVRFVYGGLIGYTFPYQKFWIGPECAFLRGSIGATSIGGRPEQPFVRGHNLSEIPAMTDLSLRWGYQVTPRLIPFITVGIALAQVHRQSYVLITPEPQPISGTYFDQKSWQSGASFGIGADYQMPSYTLRASYKFTRYDSTGLSIVSDPSQKPPAPIYSDQVRDMDQHQFLVSIIIHFGKT